MPNIPLRSYIRAVTSGGWDDLVSNVVPPRHLLGVRELLLQLQALARPNLTCQGQPERWDSDLTLITQIHHLR